MVLPGVSQLIGLSMIFPVVSLCSNTSAKIDDDNMSSGGTSCRRWRKETIVSVVVPEKCRDDDEERKNKRIFTPSM